LWGGVAQWVARLTRNMSVLDMKLYPYCLVLVGTKKGFELEFTIELK